MNLHKLQEMAEKKILVGRFEGISNDDYHSGPGISRSDLEKINKSVAHYLENKKNPSKKRIAQKKNCGLLLK